MNNLVLTTLDGENLESIHDEGSTGRGVIVLCHPHPLYGGTMTGPLIATIAKRAVESGLGVVRFNFRGVGDSTGTHDRGEAELNDVEAAATYAQTLSGGLVGIVGWSFGAAVALVWHAKTASTIPYVGIAPGVETDLSPALPAPSTLVPARRSIIVGERDQIIDPIKVAAYANSIEAELITYRGSDHFFVLRHDRLASDVLNLLDV